MNINEFIEFMKDVHLTESQKYNGTSEFVFDKTSNKGLTKYDVLHPYGSIGYTPSIISIGIKNLVNNMSESGELKNDDVVYIISSLNSLGLNDAEIATQLSWFVDNCVKLVICDIPSTYEFGVNQPMNQAILSTLLQSIITRNQNMITVSFKKSNSGRSKLPFPDDWDELYEKWVNNEITSRQFIALSGLKKATFYNLLTEYKEIQSANLEYMKQYKIV